MRTARLYGTADLRVGDEPAPETGAGEILVRVTAVGICGSDLHWYEDGAIGDAKLERPLVPGHEGAGEIAAGPRRGERVIIDPAIPCEVCRACRDGYRNLCYNILFSGHGATDGMMREVMSWPSHLLRPLPDAVSDAGGAMLEPLGVALWALDLGHVPFGGTVCVVGCGPIGLLLIQLLRAAGVSRLIAVEPLPHRREAAAKWGADETAGSDVDLSAYGADVAFELAGNDDGVRTAMEAVRPGGRVVLGGIPGSDTTTFRASLARRKGLTIAMVRRMNEVYPRAIDLAVRGVVALDPLVSSRTLLEDAPAAFAAAQRRTGLKVIVTPLSPGRSLPPLPPGRSAVPRHVSHTPSAVHPSSHTSSAVHPRSHQPPPARGPDRPGDIHYPGPAGATTRVTSAALVPRLPSAACPSVTAATPVHLCRTFARFCVRFTAFARAKLLQ